MKPNSRYIARQAILDAGSNCVGYELLYRDADVERAVFDDVDRASLQVFDSAYLFGINKLCGDLSAFINCSRDVLASDIINVLQPNRTVLEILETVEPDTEVLRACERLKMQGFTLALDDFVPNLNTYEFLPLVDIVKIDMQDLSPEVVSILQDRVTPGTKLLAERVETMEEYQKASDLGCELFQGFYFFKPQVMATNDLSPTRISSLRMLQSTMKEDLQFSELEEIVKQDAALCYRLLRFINSAEFCLRSSVQSVRHALALLGERNTRRWAMLTSMVVAGDDKSRELLRSALMRARMLEHVAPLAKCSEYEGFLVGLLSLMAAIFDSPKLADGLEVPLTVGAALAGKQVRLRKLLDLAESYERSEWRACEELAKELKLTEFEVSNAYLEAADWVSRIPI